MKKYLFLFLLFFYPFLTAAEPIQLVENGATQYSIVLPESPTPVQETAANELADYLKKITGVTFPIVSEDQVENQDALLIIGPSAASAKWLAKENLPEDTALAYDQVLIQQSGSSVILSGHPQRGMLYAVYTFLENDLGCRWWTSTEELIPKNSSPVVSVTPVSYAPRLKIRESFYYSALGEDKGVFATRLKCNGASHIIPEQYGSRQITHLGHSFYYLIPPTKYFQEHPEWFPEIDGVRKLNFTWDLENFLKTLPEENRGKIGEGGTQLCLSNEELMMEMAKNAIEELRKHPDAAIISISQNDNNKGGYCHCAKCAAIDEEEGSHSGSLIRFVNRVAEEIEKVYPHVYVDTFAYEHTRKPPKITHARHNVIIRLCSIECSYIQPKETGEQNKDFAEDVKGWNKMASNLYVWNYAANFTNFYLPFPNFRILANDFRFFADHHVIGVFEEGDFISTEGNFTQMRAWVTAKLLWDPSLQTEDLMMEFLSGYYAPEIAPLYMEYFNLMANECERANFFLTIYQTNTDGWLTLKGLNRATVLHRRAKKIAEQLAKKDPEKYGNLPHKVMIENLTIEMLWALNGANFQREAQETGKKYLGPEDPRAAAQDFFSRFEGLFGYKFRENASQDLWNQLKTSTLKSYEE